MAVTYCSCWCCVATFFLLPDHSPAIDLLAASRHGAPSNAAKLPATVKKVGAEREMTMKLSLAIALGCLLAAGLPIYAQTGGIRVNVPFRFFVASRALPPGEYTVSALRDSVVLWDSQGKRVAMVISNSLRRTGGDTGQIVFDCYTGRCYLSQVRTPDPNCSREVLRSKEEIELAKQEPAKPFVLVASPAK